MPTTWLDAICNPDARNRPSFVASPKTAKINGAVYSVASDSARIVFLPGDLGYDMTDREEDNMLIDVFEATNKMLAWEESVERLRGWAGEPVACDYQGDHGKTCGSCHGTGKVPCECDACGNTHEASCEVCEGTGRGDQAVCRECSFDAKLGIQTERFGWIADGVLVNRHLFDGVLSNVVDTILTITVGNQFDPVLLVGQTGLRIIVMPARHERHEGVESRLSSYQAKPVRRGHLLASV
jgi:hypothetical protein